MTEILRWQKALRLVMASMVLLCYVAGVLLVQGCKHSSDGVKRDSAQILYLNTLQLFDKTHPGFGLDVAFTTQKAHHPKAYALFASAEVLRFRSTGDPVALDNAILAAQWLAKNSDLDHDGEVGWGFPFPWDAGGDGSVNAAYTEYTIDTAFVIQALLDVYDVVQEAKLDVDVLQYLATAASAIETFVRGKRYDEDKSGIVFWYSTVPEDSYYVVNVSAMLVGQLQRLSRYKAPTSSLYAQLADRGIKYILAQAHRQDGLPFWMYYGDKWPTNLQNNRPNDLQHEAYTVQGLLDYKKYGGKYGDLIDLRSLLKTLYRFIGRNQVYVLPLDYPYPDNLQSFSQNWPEIWRVGYALYVARQLEISLATSCDLSERLADALTTAYYREGSWLLRPDSDQTINIYPRQRAFVLIGLASYAFLSCN